jgi:hypothetical protein
MGSNSHHEPFKAWEVERNVNTQCFDRKRFDCVPVVAARTKPQSRQGTSPQLAWEARRKHSPYSFFIDPAWDMDCLYVRVLGEETYVRGLWKLTSPSPRDPEEEVSKTVICGERPLLPLRWAVSRRITSKPEVQHSQRGSLNIPGEKYARDSQYALYVSSLMADHGDPGRFIEEHRKEYKNRRNGVLLSWSQVEYYQIPPRFREALYPKVPRWWGEWEAPGGMCVPLPAVLTYRGSYLIRGDPLHWCIFRTEWVINVFSRFVADAYHRGILWRLPSKVREGIVTLGVDTLLEGSPYRSKTVYQLITLQANYLWEELSRNGYGELQAVPLERLGSGYIIRELPPLGQPEQVVISDDRGDEAEVIASVTKLCIPPNSVLGLAIDADRKMTTPHERMFFPVLQRDGPRTGIKVPTPTCPRVLRSEPEPPAPCVVTPNRTSVGRFPEDRVTRLASWHSQYPYFEQPDAGYTARSMDYIHATELEAYLSHYGRLGDVREYTRGEPLSTRSIGRALCLLIDSRDETHRRGDDLFRKVQDLERELLEISLQNHATAQSLRILTAELLILTKNFNQQVEGCRPLIVEGKEERDEPESHKRARTRP